jgi:hypothetical protein
MAAVSSDTISLLLGEVDIIAHRYTNPETNDDTRYVLAFWALRMTNCHSSRPRPNLTIPLKAIVEVRKRGGKKRVGWYGIEATVLTGAIFRIPFARGQDTRPQFFQELTRAVSQPFRFDLRVWVSGTEWRDRLADASGWDLVDNDFCASYPPQLLVPPGVTGATLRACAEYRAHGRIPFLSFVFPSNRAPLLRAAMPQATRACAADQELLMRCCGGRRLAILDCGGKLPQISIPYDDASTEFLGFSNIHKVREAFLGVVAEHRGNARDWAALTLQLLRGAKLAVQKLTANQATLLFGADGWDRTAQVSSLVQVIVDPQCRTIQGFQGLVQKEWCDAGHLFALRNNHAPHGPMPQTSPIFAQFIDAVWQLVAAQPDAFEYNEAFLAFAAFHSYAQLYGDFLANCYKDRTEAPRPPSMWACLDDPDFAAAFMNANFAPTAPIAEVTEYRFSELIFAGPIPGCNSAVPLLTIPPLMAGMESVDTRSLIPSTTEPIPLEPFDGDELIQPVYDA